MAPAPVGQTRAWDPAAPHLRLLCELIGTAILIVLGNGAVANVHLKDSKGYHGGWGLIAMGYGFGVMVPVPAYIGAQMAGAMIGQLAIVATHKPYYDRTTDPEDVLATFATVNAAHSRLNGFANEFLGTWILVFAALGILRSPVTAGEPAVAHLAIGFLVWALVVGVGGPTGPALNPARDLGPRIVHALLA